MAAVSSGSAIAGAERSVGHRMGRQDGRFLPALRRQHGYGRKTARELAKHNGLSQDLRAWLAGEREIATGIVHTDDLMRRIPTAEKTSQAQPEY